MPSTTFSNLPEEKREKLLAAARQEFARVPYAEASVNKIIHTAGIPRGSFYMYFTDKGELFYYLLGRYGQELEALMAALLDGHGGDLFAAFLALYDRVQERWSRGEYRELADILRLNGQMRPNVFLNREGPGPMLLRLRERIDLSRLDLREEGDLESVFHLLVSVTGAALMHAGPPGAARARLVQIFGILRRGAEKRPALASE